jgi:hypothetical protein
VPGLLRDALTMAPWSCSPEVASWTRRRAALTRAVPITNVPVTASSTIMIGPPTNSAVANRQPSSTMSTTPSSMTRFVEANMKIIDVVKSAPFWDSDFAIAVAAYEHDDDTTPSPLARVTAPARWSPRTRCISPGDPKACTAPASEKPKISGQSVS